MVGIHVIDDALLGGGILRCLVGHGQTRFVLYWMIVDVLFFG